MRIGFIGAGRLGQALAQRLVATGHEIMLSNSRGREAVQPIAARLGCAAGAAADAARFGAVVVVSVPLKAFDALPAQAIGGRIVVDTCNYYPQRDGEYPELERGQETTSGLLQKALPEAVVVKAFNSVLATHLARGGAPTPDGPLHALPYASDTAVGASIGERLIAAAGFDPVFCGALAGSWRFERARPGYCRALPAEALRSVLEQTTVTDFVPEGSWRT
ncbi:MAG: NAD(P)-binding domain-containing protein [Methylobacteriaceae bacterium]|nr:NAD(P)-binding domain-containing protein [Methylobacteriaceae bacterium]